MGSNSLESLESIDLRKIWPNEESDFTPWLAEQDNLDMLGNALGMSLDFLDREAAVGPFSADILCQDTETGGKVIVENQLEAADHDHLGKLLTYAAHFNARIVVWITKRFDDQHRAALDWLNEVSEAGTRFFGLEIEVWRIGDSACAPKFNVVARPNDWTKGDKSPRPPTSTQQMQLEFWEGFSEFVFRNGNTVKKINSPRPQNWLGMGGVGRSGFYLSGVVSTWSEEGGHELRAELVISGNNATHYFDFLRRDRERIDEEFGEELVWHNPIDVQQRKIFSRLATRFDDPDRRTVQYRWLLERLEALHRVLAPRVQALPSPT